MDPSAELADAMSALETGARCSACLDSRKCWVCLGQGSTEDRYGKRTPCVACGGSGACPHCLPVPSQRASAD